jgi:hypothetical protein
MPVKNPEFTICQNGYLIKKAIYATLSVLTRIKLKANRGSLRIKDYGRPK